MNGVTSSSATIQAHNNIERQFVVEIVRKWAEVNTDGVLDTRCTIFTVPGIEGLIGYRIEAGNAIVFGDPVCSPIDKPSLAIAFQEHCHNQKLGVVYTIVSEPFARWATKNLDSVLVEWGEKFVLNPTLNPLENTGSKAVLVRKKVKHALRDGITVEEYLGNNELTETAIQQVATSWLKARRGPQIYLAQVSLFDDRMGKRWFYAKQKEQIVGILMLNELQAHRGWLLNNVMLTKEATPGVSELLVIEALQILAKENCQHVIIGPVPRKKIGEITGLKGLMPQFIRWLYTCATKLFHLSGHEAFWEKFQPTIHASYLIFPHHNLSFSSIKALLKAFNVRF